MELSYEVGYYIICYFPHLMTDVERRAQRHLSVTMKATMGRRDAEAQQQARTNRVHSRFLSNDPEVLPLTNDGYESFVQQTAQRMMRESGKEIFFNRCTNCGELARTPTAKQCRFCGHDWH